VPSVLVVEDERADQHAGRGNDLHREAARSSGRVRRTDMRWSCALIVIALVAVAARAGEAGPKRFRFDKNDLDKAPAGWTIARTGPHGGSVLKVVEDKTAPSKTGRVLAQTSASPKVLFNLCVVDKGDFDDVEVSVAFKAVEGKKDQGGGIVWRYVDPDNYYVARFNPLEDNYRLYKVVAGKRIQLETKETLTAPAGEWHTLKIRQAGDRIECWLDGKKHLEAKDDTFKKAGKVGLWTKADAQTYFDNFEVKAAR